MISPAFTYDYVRVRPEHQIGLHSHDLWELSLVVNGGGTRIIGSRREAITAGELILIPPGISHVWQFDGALTDRDGCISNITVLFRDDLIDGLSVLLPEIAHSVSTIKAIHEAKSYVGETKDKIVDILHQMHGKTAEVRLPEMIRLLSLLAVTEGCRGVGCGRSLSKVQMRLESVRVYCSCNYARQIALAEVASYVKMNKSSFCTFMQRHAGMTFSKYLNECRLAHAMEMLKHTDDNISDIAYSVGFATVTYFNRLFREKYGRAPKQVRYERY